MDQNIFLERTEKVRKAMSEKGIDVFLAGPSSNLFYLTGIEIPGDERLFLLILPQKSEPFILANLLYKEQIKTLTVNEDVFWKDGEDPFKLLKTEIEKRNINVKAAAFEARLPALFSLPLLQAFPGARFVLGSSLVDPLRRIKDAGELDCIRKACRESDRALTALIDRGSYWIGKTETEFHNALSEEFSRGGLSAFGASVQAGSNAAIPHYNTGNAVIKEGCLLVDFWGRYEGYYTDCSRTFCFGRPEPAAEPAGRGREQQFASPPDAEFEKIHAIVLEAQLAAEAKARPGNTLNDVDKAARSVIEKYGYGEYFNHRTGHGVGIDVHEGTSVNTGEYAPVEPGMVFSIEPGIYLPGRFGVRIENLVAIGETCPEILHNYPRKLQII
jgi:Xaa-Pro dipeptidase